MGMYTLGKINKATGRILNVALAMVSHDQDDDISSEIAFPDAELLSMNCNVAYNSVEKAGRSEPTTRPCGNTPDP